MSTSPLAVVAAQRCRIAVWDAPSLNPYLDIADHLPRTSEKLCRRALLRHWPEGQWPKEQVGGIAAWRAPEET